MNYLIRSNCPFGSACIDGACAVVCPMPSKEEGTWKEKMSCVSDGECDCGSYAASDAKSCRCIDGACVAVMRP
ncbi:MAG: hypothetical protein PHP01_08015 [Phycisphaerae bacterium]|nr:hypothetical protein [Phycisphaerae bacterium]